MKYQQELDDAYENMEEITKAFKKLGKKKHNKVDQVFHELHDEAFEKIDCLECGNCCKTTSPIFRDIDGKRIAKKMKMSHADFEKNYLKKDSDGDWVLKSSPCVFLAEDNSCNIYDYRPQACREYPHTDRKRMISILDLTLKNVEVCPAVAKIALEIPNKFI
ncbi:MAG: YkgJ family cysteine cluster protein [Fluviicola sp.]|nr:YkgJ family cysteine cluster protein [Fluviicola sp.]